MEIVPDEAVVLWTTLDRLRRRQRLVTIAEYGLAAVLVVSAAALSLSLTLTTPGLAIRLVLALAGVAAAAVAGAAIVRTPTPRRIAALADARLNLEDRLVTALQYVNDPDPVSRLVVRDAVTRTEGASAAAVFPFRAPSWMAWTAAAALAVSATFALFTPSGGAGRMNGPARDGVPGAAGSADSRAITRDAAVSTTPSDEGAIRQSGAAAAARPIDGAQSAGRTDDRGQAAGQHLETSVAPPARSEDGRVTEPIALPAAPPTAANALAPHAARTPSSGDAGSAGGTTSGRSTMSGSGGASPRGTGAGSGGAARTDGAAPQRARRGNGAASDSAAYARAEAALANESIPPGLRAYLKAYFTAIRPR